MNHRKPTRRELAAKYARRSLLPVLLTVGLGLSITTGVANARSTADPVTYPLAANSVAGKQVVNGSMGIIELDAYTRGLIENPISSSDQIAPKTIDKTDLNQALQDEINGPVGPIYLPNWGTIFRNVIGNGSTVLGQSSAGTGLAVNTPAATDQATFGNELDYAGKPVALTAVKYEVFTTGENSAKAPNNMPSIKFEMNPDVTGQAYTTLVYAPNNSASNEWTAIDAKADTGKHWGFTGNATSYFGTPATQDERCGINGARCTLTQALAQLGGNAKFISAAVGKGRDFEFHGAVRTLTINGDTFTFGNGGVTK